MMQKIQKFGGAMFTHRYFLFAFAGVSVGIGNPVYNRSNHGKPGSADQACGTNAGMCSFRVDGPYLTSCHYCSQYHFQLEWRKNRTPDAVWKPWSLYLTFIISVNTILTTVGRSVRR